MRISSSILFAGLVLRILFSIFLYHPDVKSQHFHAQFLSQGVVDIYSYVPQNIDTLSYKDTFNYPPLSYYLLGSWNYLASLMAGSDLNIWINNWGSSSLENDSLFNFLLVLKFPYIITDLLIFALIYVVTPINKRRIVSFIWVFNPFSLYAIFAIGQFDSLPALCTLTSLLAFYRKKYLLVGLMLGLGVALKTYPILLIPFFLIFSRSLLISLKVGIVSFLTWFAPMLPILGSVAFVNTVFKSSLGSLLFAFKLSIGNINFPIYIIFYFLMLLFALKNRHKLSYLLAYCFIIPFSILVFTESHPQWLVWSMPFAVLLGVKNRVNSILLSLLGIIFFINIFLIPDQFLSIALLTPLNPSLITLPPISSFIPQLSRIQFVSRVILAIIFLPTIFYSLKKARHV